jgi:ubiquinone/menaquinone biosynthesis C-methylase UbiE
MHNKLEIPPTSEAAFVGSIPEHYHRGLGPTLFEPYARETAARVAAVSPRRVLETACGTGIVTRRLREALPADAQLVATDLNEPMVAVARSTVGRAARVDWDCADMTRLPFSGGEFDAVVCQFGLMFVPDKPAALREARRVLAPGGRLFLATWQSLAKNTVARLAHEAVGWFFPDDPPQFYNTPFGFGEPEQIVPLLVEAGFEDVRAEAVEKQTVFESARELAIGFIDGYPITDLIKAHDPSLLPRVIDRLAGSLADHFGEGAVETRIWALLTTGSAPART